ncbi:MAG TPA: hypothetical protein VFQ61_13810 [Polyangiaceae bacterium]|nr:hypothetical protein [Polyangiaceae bacterium]
MSDAAAFGAAISRPNQPGAAISRRRRPNSVACLASLLGGVPFTAIALTLSSTTAHAAPQANTALVPGVCISQGSREDSGLAFCGAVRQDLLFLRGNPRAVGFGPYASIGTLAFDDLRISLGASLLLPTLEDLPLVLSAGALTTNFGRVGVESSVFFGLRSYNFHGTYNLAGGLLLQLQQDLDRDARRSVGLGIQVDAMVLALPVLLLWGATR